MPNTYPAFLREELVTSWREIDFGPTKIETGFRLAAELANSAPDLANTILEEVQTLRADLVLDSSQCAQTYSICCRLAIRAFSGLIKKKIYSETDINDLAELIDNIPSNRLRAYAWSELALRLCLDGQEADCRHVCDHQPHRLSAWAGTVERLPGARRHASALDGGARRVERA